MQYGKTAKALYNECETLRQTYLERARECSELTIPTLVPPQGHSFATKYVTPYQGIGARGVNNLASKLLLTLFPPNSPFFRLSVDRYKLIQLGGDNEAKTELEKALSEIERTVMREVETSALRVPVFEALKHLVVAGNVLVVTPKEGGIRVFQLENYIVKRDPYGNVLHIVTKETVSPSVLPDDIKGQVNIEALQRQTGYNEPTIDLYTAVCRQEDGRFYVWQEAEGTAIPGTEGYFKEEDNPYIPLRYSRVDGEDYGRGLVEEYLGDLKSLEALTQAIVKLAAASSNIKILVDPNGTTKAKALAESPSGAFVSGRSNDVSVLQLEKFADLRVAKEVAEAIEQRLSFAFLLNAAVQRDAERVTAEEIRFMAQELEAALGGAYSILSQEFQLPLVTRIMDRMAKEKRLPKVPKGDLVKPMIVTGVEALGRGNDLSKLDMFVAGVGQIFGPEAIQQYVNVSDYLNRRATSLGIDTEGLIRSQEDVQAEAQAQQQQMMMARMTEKLGPQAIRSATETGMMQQQAEEAGEELPLEEEPPQS